MAFPWCWAWVDGRCSGGCWQHGCCRQASMEGFTASRRSIYRPPTDAKSQSSRNRHGNIPSSSPRSGPARKNIAKAPSAVKLSGATQSSGASLMPPV